MSEFKNISKGNIFVDSKAKPLINNVSLECSRAEKSLREMASIFNKAVYKKIVSGEDAKRFVQLSKRLNNTANKLSKGNRDLLVKYNVDEKDFAIKKLNKRISLLEEKINSITSERD